MQDEARAGCLRKMKATPPWPECVKEVMSLLVRLPACQLWSWDIKPGDVGLVSGGWLPGLLLVSEVILRFCHNAHRCCVAVRCHRHLQAHTDSQMSPREIFRFLKEVNRRGGEVSVEAGCGSISVGCGEKGAWRRGSW